MISEGSIDTEDWSNDAANTALITVTKLYFNISITFYFIVIVHGTTK